jgi:hypothetical protein
VNLPPEAARARERSVFARLWAGPDHVEASSAFIEKTGNRVSTERSRGRHRP